MKLEKFVFDVFQFAESFVMWECIRCEQDSFKTLIRPDMF